MKYRVLTGVSVGGKQWIEGETFNDGAVPEEAVKEWLKGKHIEEVKETTDGEAKRTRR